LVWRVMKTVADRHGRTLPAFRMRVRNEIPITKGLGSSASACLAGVVAADFLCGLGLERGEWLDLASGLEGHPDNAAPSLYGGFVVSLKGETIQCARCEFPADWTIVAVTPELELETRTARAVLPAHVPHRHAVMNVQHAAYLVAQIIRGRKDGLRAAMEDYLHQPYRADLIPGLREILAMDPQDGLLGVALSGAGPTVIALADRNETRIGDRIREIFGKNGLASQVRALKADRLGLTCEAAEVSP
ncbi:MAG: homoserine kinase, partial [Acidobacteria bacterium]|nr:homoserine kinase [Acidobacteriota bacterium]